MQLSIAPLRYRNVFKKDGGPIDRLSVAAGPLPTGRNGFRAGAFLDPLLRPLWLPKQQLYNNTDGGGTHALRSVACYMAISEALERWAFFAESRGPFMSAYAFDIEPSSTGMAAFPGLISKPARSHAYLEAVERWSLIEWWMGKLPAKLLANSGPSQGYLEIQIPFSHCAVGIVWRQCSFGGLSYGFAAGVNIQHAIDHALIEQSRNTSVLERLFRDRLSSPNDFSLQNLGISYERRLVFFASDRGASLFWQKVEETCHLKATPGMPRKIVDIEINGPWTQYATVWRVLYEQSAYEHLNKERTDFFLF